METVRTKVAKDGTIRAGGQVLRHMLGKEHTPGTEVSVTAVSGLLHFAHVVKDSMGTQSKYVPARGGR